MNLIDTHCHLDVEPLVKDTPGVLARARAADVTQVIAVAYDLGSWPAVAALAAGNEGVYPALGLHPWVADQALDLEQLEQALLDCHAVAVGEVGLDFRIEIYDRDLQKQAFVDQLQVARKLDLPVILHCRGAFEDMLTILAEAGPGLRGVVHAFSRGVDIAQRFVAMGLHIGLGGAITRSRARRARRSAEVIPLDRLVLETDAPSIGLEDIAPQDVEPCHVREVAAALAEIRGVSLEEIAEVTSANARGLFRLA
jgi:TatD DNase family protein